MGRGEMWACMPGVVYLFFHMNMCTFKYDSSLNLVYLLFLYFLCILSITVVSRSRTVLCYIFSSYIRAMLSMPCLMFSGMVHFLITEPRPLSLNVPKSLGRRREGVVWIQSLQLLTFWTSSGSWWQLQRQWAGQHQQPFLTSSTGIWFLCCNEGSAEAGNEGELTELPLPCFQQNQGGFTMPK